MVDVYCPSLKCPVVLDHYTVFSYGPSRARYKRVDTAGTQVTTTLYLGSVEKVYYPDGSIQWKRNIAGVGLITQTVNSSGTKLSEAQRYLIKDHLGSLSLITDEIGAVEQSNYFDPWGKQRKIITSSSIKQWAADTTSFVLSTKPITTRGFTGHEQLAEVGLIHMNGRIYDGALGRFVQADPIIQDPMRVQSLNRYSYVWNNPLNATDPSGFQCINAGEQVDPKAKDCVGAPDRPVQKDTEKGGAPRSDAPNGKKVKELDKGNCWVNACYLGILPSGIVANGTAKLSQNSLTNNAGAPGAPTIANKNGSGSASSNQSADTSNALKETKGATFRMLLYGLASALVDGNQLMGDILADASGGKSPTSAYSEEIGKAAEVLDRNSTAAAGSVDKTTLVVTATIVTVAAIASKKKSSTSPTVGPQSTLEKLSPAEQKRIQNAANRSGVNIAVVGSRVNSNKQLHPRSDYDYVIDANASTRNSLSRSLPGSKNVSEGTPSNLDIFKGSVDSSLPHIIFHPQ